MTGINDATLRDALRHHRNHAHLDGAFGVDSFGRRAEAMARFFGTPSYILGQTAIVAAWVAHLSEQIDEMTAAIHAHVLGGGERPRDHSAA